MIPIFPNFKNLELGDRKFIEDFTKSFAPYSDFDFTTLWCWDIDGSTQLSSLNDNLVISLRDLVSGQVVCSFMGNNEVNSTAATLTEYCLDPQTKPERLALVPECSIQGLDNTQYHLRLDESNSDYIFNLQKISSYNGSSLYKKKKLARLFESNHLGVQISQLDLSNSEVIHQIQRLNDKWVQNRTQQSAIDEGYLEPVALKRLLDLRIDNLSAIGVIYNSRIVAYLISQILNDGYAIGLFGKFDREIKGLNEYLMRESAKILTQANCQLYNAGEDLGQEGLRLSKSLYRPEYLLKKFTITKN